MPHLHSDAIFVIFAAFFVIFAQNANGHAHTTPEGFMMGKQIVANDFSDHPCRRTCRPGGKPMVCKYNMELAWYTTMGRACFFCPNQLADCEKPGCILGSGTQRPVLVVNRVLPGPSIEVCLGDRIRVTVDNMMQNGESVGIHWHGLHQRNSPHMDGVPMYSQCPINSGTKFTYDFEADMTGTYLWHSHTGLQRTDGIAGPLIIRDKKDPYFRKLYDQDDLKPCMTQDWFPAETHLHRFSTYHFGNADFRPTHILVNGRWPTDNLTDTSNTTLPNFPCPVPPFVYHLNPKLRYRFRLINNAFWNTPMKFTFKGHHLVVIAADGHLIKPVVTKTITMMSAERFDAIPHLTGEENSPNAEYHIEVVALGDSEGIPTAKAFAKIVYDGGVNPTPSNAWQASGGETSIVVEEVNYWSFTEHPVHDPSIAMKASDLRSITNKPRINRKPDLLIVAEFDFRLVEDPRLYPVDIVRQDAPYVSPNFPHKFITPQINKITSMMPSCPLLTQFDEIPKKMFCNRKNRKACQSESFCECIHLVQVPLGALVEILMVDNGISDTVHDLNHPMHIHGYHFRVVAMDKVRLGLTADEVMAMDRNGQIKRNLDNAPLKDTIGVPTGGYVFARFWADNPGPWLFHCHIDFHMEFGMAMVLRVGQQKDLPPPPPKFPRCAAEWEAPRQKPRKLEAPKPDDSEEDSKQDSNEDKTKEKKSKKNNHDSTSDTS